MLQTSYGFQCETLIGSDATAGEIKAKLTNYEKLVSDDDCFLFFFAGHGRSEGDMPLLYPSDIEVKGLVANSIQASDIVRPKLKARHSLYVFDSCYSGEITNLDKFPPLNRFKRWQGLGTFDARSIQIMTSSGSNQTASDGKLQASPFAAGWLSAFTKDRFTASALFKQLPMLPGEQKPQFISLAMENDSPCGDFVFSGKPPEAILTSSTFQTASGTIATFPGAPLIRTWFDETPWLTPSVRLALDRRIQSSPADKDLLTLLTLSVPLNDRKAAVSILQEQIESGKLPLPPSEREVFSLLASLSPGDSPEIVLSEISGNLLFSRDGQSNEADQHLQAMVEIAKSTTDGQKADGKRFDEIDSLFQRSESAYRKSSFRGLHARCLADHGNWLLVNSGTEQDFERYRRAESLFTEALKISNILEPPAAFKLELHAGAAYAARQQAKSLSVMIENSPTAIRDKRRRIEQCWKRSAECYALAQKELAKMPANEAVQYEVYIAERLGWLSLDQWSVASASGHFQRAKSLCGEELSEHNVFLMYSSVSLGLATSERLGGLDVKGHLEELVVKLQERIEDGSVAVEASELYQRICNTIERLGDCAFLRGRLGMWASLETYQIGLLLLNDWEDVAREETITEKVRHQRLRFLAKCAIAASVAEDDIVRRKYMSDLEDAKSGVTGSLPAFVELLCQFAQRFSALSEARSAGEDDAVQNAIDEIRKFVQQNSHTVIDREPAELIMLLAQVVSDEQCRLDGLVLKRVLPQGADNGPPRQMTRFIRLQYDRIIMLQGKIYDGIVPSKVEFRSFCDLVLGTRETRLSAVERANPFVIFYFPLDGSNGLEIHSLGLSKPGEIRQLDFGWKEIGKLGTSEQNELSRNMKSGSMKVCWGDDRLLTEESGGTFPKELPFNVGND